MPAMESVCVCVCVVRPEDEGVEGGCCCWQRITGPM